MLKQSRPWVLLGLEVFKLILGERALYVALPILPEVSALDFQPKSQLIKSRITLSSINWTLSCVYFSVKGIVK